MLPELASGFTRAYTRLILRSPSLTVLVLVLVTLLLLKPALTFEQNMTRDIEVYLPEGEESTDLLLEVRKDWATDIIIIYIETRNANDPERFNDRVIHNITYVPTLKEIARLEQQIDPYGQSMDQDKYQADRGIQDDIIFTLSISTLIKEFKTTVIPIQTHSSGRDAGIVSPPAPRPCSARHGLVPGTRLPPLVEQAVVRLVRVATDNGWR